MRHVSLLALSGAALSLAACAAGSGSSSVTALALAENLSVCTVNDTSPACNPSGSGSGSGSSGSSGGTGGTGSGVGGTGNGGAGTGTQNTGSTVNLATGDPTLIIEKSLLKSPISNPGLSRLTYDAGGRAQIEIDTNLTSSSQANWPQPKYMREYVAGSTANDPFIAPDNLGGTYKEYRALTYNTSGGSADEVLQVWTWGNSYATQYRNLAEGGEASQQAWSFGGTRTSQASMPVAGTLNYSGRFGATAKTWNWVEPSTPGRTISVNNLWRVTGASTATADFGTGSFTATLTPEIWVAYASLNGASGFDYVDAATVADPNWNSFMDDAVNISGTITTSATTGNAITGTAELDPAQGWVTNETVNPFYGAFFGAGAAEVTGVFNLEAVQPDPIGGDIPINDDRRGFLQMSGAMNAQ
jgi:hypothetical protein